MKKLIVLCCWLCLFFAGLSLRAQTPVSWRTKTVAVTNDTLILDSLSIQAGTFTFTSGSITLDSSSYTLDAFRAMLVLRMRPLPDSITVRYAVFPFSFIQVRSHKDMEGMTTRPGNRVNPFVYNPRDVKQEDPFAMGGLNKSGNLSRGISFGNNRDISVNSSLNLQLNGKLTDNLDLMMVATDDNLPIQPDGTTQQLQEFDRVYIQLSSRQAKLIAGDFFTVRPNSYFMNYNKRGQGLSATYSQSIKTADTTLRAKLNVTAAAAVSKGKFARNIIPGVEGNQGPYRLRGAENELFIIVLGGTEQVFVDGKLLVRGQENDYIIDYNTAEITFTAKQPMTKDKRIVVEFQYTDRNYGRVLIQTGVEYTTTRHAIRINAFNEQDNKNQPLQQTLTDSDKHTMFDIGDTLNRAIVSGVDSVAFSGDVVLYKKIDTLISAVIYRDVYVYSTNSDSARYRCSFSFVGTGNGNYVQVASSANGKVFQWRAPINGISQGDHEPVVLLITPKKRQMVVVSGDAKVGKTGSLRAEGAVSGYDKNTFSPYDSSDDDGYGAFVAYKDKRKIKDSLFFVTDVMYEYISANFTPIERYRAVEFERDWNLGWGTTTAPVLTDQHIVSASAGIQRLNRGGFSYQYGTFLGGSVYMGNKHAVQGVFRHRGTAIQARASQLNTSGATGSSSFFRNRIDASQALTKWLTIGGWQEYEDSKRTLTNSNLAATSFSYLEWEGFVQLGDSSKKSLRAFYKQRIDNSPRSNRLERATYGESIGASFLYRPNAKQTLRVTTTYRVLEIIDTTLILLKPDRTVVGRLEYSARALKNVIQWNTFYEAGSGQELRREFSYIEVPTGQGVYTWTDYNGNGVKELNEFEIALYTDQANYIRVFTPTTDYIRVYSSQFTQSIFIKPGTVWANKKGVRGVVARFSNQFVYRTDRKTTSSLWSEAFLPVTENVIDTSLVALNTTMRNTIFFNQLSTKFGVEYTWQELSGKSLLTNGLEARSYSFHEIRIRWNLTRSWSVTNEYRDGIKINNSQFFATRNYRISYVETAPRISWQPSTTFRLAVNYRYSDKHNSEDLGGDRARVQKVGAELKSSRLQKGTMTAEFNYFSITYDGTVSSAVGYEMLEGLKPGSNYTWKLNWQRALTTTLQLTIGYDGRKTPDNKAIHVGTAQVRAVF